MHARILLYVFLALAAAIPSEAQWVKTSGPSNVRALITTNGAQIYAGTSSGVFLSSDSGTNWTARNNGLTHMNIRSGIIRPGTVFVGTEGGGIFRSTNNGTSWVAVNTGLTGLDVRAMAFSESHLFAGTNNGVFRSADDGATWTAFSSGLTDLDIRALASITTGIPTALGLYAGTGGAGVFRLANGASSWSAQNDSLTNLDVRALGNQESWLFAGTAAGAYRWEANHLPPRWNLLTVVPSAEIHAMAGVINSGAHQNEWVLAGTAGAGVFVLRVDGPASAINEGLTDLHVHAVSAYESFGYWYLFIGTPSGIWRRPKLEVIPQGASIQPGAGSQMRFRINPTGSVSFTLTTSTRVTLTAFTPSGQKVAVLIAEEFPAGSHTRRVDKDEATLPNGLYVYRLRVGDATESRTVVRTR